MSLVFEDIVNKLYFPPFSQKYFEVNQMFSVVLVHCDKMGTIASLGVKEEIKNILDSRGLLRDVQQFLQSFHTKEISTKFPHKKNFYTNNNTSTIASFGVKEEIKNILDCAGLFKTFSNI